MTFRNKENLRPFRSFILNEVPDDDIDFTESLSGFGAIVPRAERTKRTGWTKTTLSNSSITTVLVVVAASINGAYITDKSLMGTFRTNDGGSFNFADDAIYAPLGEDGVYTDNYASFQGKIITSLNSAGSSVQVFFVR
jgi:hypothetical protein